MNQIKLFLESIKSGDTKKQYTYCLKKFFDFVGSEGELPMIEGNRKQDNRVYHFFKEGRDVILWTF